jgi:hypothetical protein
MARTADQILQDTLGAQTLQIIQLMALVEQLQERVKTLEEEQKNG